MNGPTDSVTQEFRREHLAALDVLRHAKNMTFWLAMLAILAHVGAWYAVRHTTLLNGQTSGEVDTSTAGSTAGVGDANKAYQWEVRIEGTLGVAGLIGRAAIVLLMSLYVLSLLVSLSARLGGAAGMAKACVWSLLAMALLVPWDRVTPQEYSNLPSAFFSLDDVTRAAVTTGWDLSDTIRFAAFPLVILMLLMAGQWAYRSGYARIVAAPAARLAMREV